MLDYWINNKDLPNWADAFQVCIALIGMIAAVIGAWKLLARDKDRQKEIKSLRKIALKLQDLMQLNEKRYAESKKPQIEVTCDRDFELAGNYFLYFKNYNSQSHITKYELEDPRGYKGRLATRITNNGKEQEFSFSFAPPKQQEMLIMPITYNVEDGYEFKQELLIYHHHDKLVVKAQFV